MAISAFVMAGVIVKTGENMQISLTDVCYMSVKKLI